MKATCVADLDCEGALSREPADLHLPLPQSYCRKNDKRGCPDRCLYRRRVSGMPRIRERCKNGWT